MKGMTNTNMLEIALIKSGITKKELANGLGISIQTLYNKLSNEAEFKASEITKATKILNLNRTEREEIFFAKCVE
jgi:DNA-binding XRE family transcriptional regulator